MTAVDKVIELAKSEIGYLEKANNSQLDSKTANAGYNNYTKYARDLDKFGNIYNGAKQGYAYCDVFVDWLFITSFGVDLGMKLLCQPYNGGGAGCTYSMGYYKNKGQFHKSNPQPGDQIFFTNDGGKTSNHTGLVVRNDGSRVYTIEGNTSSAAGVVANGGCVRDKSYSLSYNRIAGYGRPDWSLAESVAEVKPKEVNYQGMVTASTLNCRSSYSINSSIVSAYAKGTIINITKECDNWGYTGKGWVSLEYISKINSTPLKKEDEDMTQEKFNQMMDNYLKALANEKATWEMDAIKWANDEGFLIGDEKGNLKPKSFVTRGELATVLQRMSNKEI